MHNGSQNSPKPRERHTTTTASSSSGTRSNNQNSSSSPPSYDFVVIQKRLEELQNIGDAKYKAQNELSKKNSEIRDELSRLRVLKMQCDYRNLTELQINAKMKELQALERKNGDEIEKIAQWFNRRKPEWTRLKEERKCLKGN